MVRWLPGCCYAVTLFWTVDIVGCLPAHVKKASNKPNSLTIRPQLRNIKTLEQDETLEIIIICRKKLYIYVYIYSTYELYVSFPPSRTSILWKPGGSSRTPATCPTDCSLCPQEDISAASDPALADWGIAFPMSSQNYDTLQHTPTLWYAMHCTLTVQLDFTHRLHNTTIYPLPLDTMQHTSMTLHIRMMYNMLHLLILLCVFMFT